MNDVQAETSETSRRLFEILSVQDFRASQEAEVIQEANKNTAMISDPLQMHKQTFNLWQLWSAFTSHVHDISSRWDA